MSKKHVVKQGECLPSIAQEYGYVDWRSIYNAPENADFRKLRPDPHLLYPGDILTIPDPSDSKGFKVSIPKGNTAKIVIQREPTLLKLVVLESLQGEGCESKYELVIDDNPTPLVGDIKKDGILETLIPASARKGQLTLKSKSDGSIIKVLDLQIGNLDPVYTPSGLRDRLRRIGFDPGPDRNNEPYREGDPLPVDIENALRSFQLRFDLQETGTVTDETKAKLIELCGT